MAKSGLKHIDVGPELTKTEWESEESHEVVHGSSFPGSPVERQLFYRDDEHKWYIYTGAAWTEVTGGGGGGMEVHGNEYHDPDFEQEGAAATLVETHRTTATHTQDQPPAEHGNEKHSPDFATESALSTHEGAGTGVHGVGASTVESASGSQSKVNTHAALTTGTHGVGSNYIPQAPADSHLVRSFTKGWTADKILKGAGVDVDPIELALPGWELVDDHIFTSPATSYTISGLNGDSDIQYLITAFLVWNSASPGNIHLRPNNDSGSNYIREYLAATATTVSAASDTLTFISLGYFDAQYQRGFDPLMAIHAVSGRERGMFGFRHRQGRWFSFFTEWTNTVDEITSLVFTAEQADGIGVGSRITVWRRA